MSSSLSISTALCLAASDVEALLHGQMIAALSRSFVSSSQCFALCPVSVELEPTVIKAWAKMEFCKILNTEEEVKKLSDATIWKEADLQNTLEERGKLFLICLRVYRLAPIEQSGIQANANKIGGFIRLPVSLPATINDPVLSDQLFEKRQQQLLILQSSPHPELEELCSEVIRLSTDLNTQALENDLKAFLGWSDRFPASETVPSWIETIAQVGNSPDGNLFEKLVRKSLIKIGFQNKNSKPTASLDPEGCGGAGGLDFYCERPYPVVGECKATKNEVVSNGAPAQLIKLGNRHLKQDYEKCIKIIFAAGKLNFHAEEVAVGNKMNVIRPETLQRLVKLKADHPGSINLIDLKPCLESSPFGEEADTKLNDYINRVETSLKVRSHLIEAIKQLQIIEPERIQFEVTEIRVQYNASFSQVDGNVLDKEIVYESLIELSSPLSGYLGRVKASGINSDRFYYLRDLTI